MATSWPPIFSRTDELVCNAASISKTKTEIMNIGTNPENEGNQQHLMRAERKTRMVFLSSAVPSTSSKDARAGGEDGTSRWHFSASTLSQGNLLLDSCRRVRDIDEPLCSPWEAFSREL